MANCIVTLLAAALAGTLIAAPAQAGGPLRVAKAVPEAFSFTPLDIGIRKGFFEKNGVEVEASAFAGDAKLQQAMTANSIDMGIGSGPGMAFIVKGSPVKAVAAMAGPPLLLAIVVRPDGATNVADLKSKKISVSTAGSPDLLAGQRNFAPPGLGAARHRHSADGRHERRQIAALKRGDIDGIVMDISTAFDLENRGEGRILVRFGDLQDFIVHVIYATDAAIASRPDAIRGFLKGWFETIAFMRKNKAETVAIAKDVDRQRRRHRRPHL